MINHQTASALIDNNPREFFTDYGTPHYCRYSQTKPIANTPVWITPTTIWQRIRLGFAMDFDIQQQRVDAEFNWYQKNPSYMARVSERSRRYIYHVTEQLEQRGLPLELALLPIVESAYDPFAYSHGRASGMWQFIPATGRMYQLEQTWWFDGRRDIIDSTKAAISYLTMLNQYYNGDWLLALAAYNAGQGNVNKAIRKNKRRGKPTDFWSLDLPSETRSYVPKLLALAKLIDNPQRYGCVLYPVANSPYFVEVDTHSQIDLAQAATMAGIAIDELYRLNPGFNRWATSPQGPHRLLLPIGNSVKFQAELAKLPPQQRLHWQRYSVKNGDSLSVLAKRFNTEVDTIKTINNIHHDTIRIGQTLMIPTASEAGQHYSLSAEQRLATTQNRRRGGNNSRQIFHTVGKGDSLWTIARQYDVTVKKLSYWNGIAPKDILKPGQKLSLWIEDPVKLNTATQRDAVVRKVGYKVRNGDSLARIANKFNVKIKDILKWNSVNPKHYLQPGQRLTLYVDITNGVN